MGRGKKKGSQASESKEVESTTTALQSLTVSEGPSTSHELALATSASQITASASVQSVPSTTAPVSNVEDKEEESFGLGLGLGGGKKKRPRKKKDAQAAETVSQPALVSTPALPLSKQQEKPTLVQPSPVPPAQAHGGWQGSAPGGWQSAGHSQEPVVERGRGQEPFSGRGRGQEQFSGRGREQEAFAGRGGRGESFGRGRGESHANLPSVPTQQAPPREPQAAWSQPQAIPRPNEAPLGQKRAEIPIQPATSYTAVPSATQSKVSVSTRPTPRSSDTALCRFQVPKKIIGNTVRARPITVLTNYLPMTIKALKIHRYDISFTPDRPKKLLPKAFMISKNMHFKNLDMAFDQMKNCYCLHPLPKVSQNDRFTTNVELTDNNGKNMKFEVSYKYTGQVDLGTILNYMKTGGTSLSPPTEAIQCIDVILRQGTLESYVKAGRQYFRRPANPVNLGDGLEMWTGLFQSGIFTSRAFINIDVAHKGFPKQQPLIQALINDFRLDATKPLEKQSPWFTEKFLAFLKGVKVVASIGGDNSSAGQRREFICNGIVKSAIMERFMYEDPTTKAQKSMSVAEYFAREKGVRLRYPDLNCVWVGPREKTIYYPMELLEVAYGHAQNKQLNETQLATMVRQAATPPDVRKKKIEEVIQNMNYTNNKTFKNFGLDISNQFLTVNAKVLQPPRLEVGNGQIVEPRRGVWQANGVYKPEALQSWGFIAIECDPGRSDFDGIIKMTMSLGTQMGMRTSPPIMTRFDVKMRELQSVLFTALDKEVKFLFIVVSARGRDYYHKVKQMAERDVGILTQCIKEQTAMQRMNQQTVRNILLKVNSKLMGINQALDVRVLPKCLKDGGVMVVGADVTHPSPDQSSIPSIAAVTASTDPKCSQYNIELSIQTPKKEVIVEFEDMMVDHLKVYRQQQRSLPRKIFVFRDGVSEGQFAQVMNCELQAVHNAYRTVAGTQAKPEVLFLLVQKRHHTRLFVPNSPQNVEPGTVVDTDIVHASELDFYLVSHQAIKGTARPTRYHAVCNDGAIPHDEVEQMTYYLCHLYSRCMRAVSYPTPTYYAHLACLRARSLTHGERFDNTELERKPKRLRVMDKILQFSRMFFV